MDFQEHVAFPAEEQWYLNFGIIEDALEFFNLYYKLKEHPFTMDDIRELGNFQFALKLESIVWRSFKVPELAYYRANPLEFWKNMFKHMTQSHYLLLQAYMRKAMTLDCRTVLDYGGGSGVLSYLLSCHGFDVTFAEVNLVALGWMRYLRIKRGLKFNVVDLFNEKLTQKYDLVICKDVMEHVENPDVLLEELKALTGKQIILSGEDIEEEDWLPMHHKYKSIKVEL